MDAVSDFGENEQVIAADIPSGVDASTGEVQGAAVRAVATATFHAAKPGLWIAPGKARCGAVSVIARTAKAIPTTSRRAAIRRRATSLRYMTIANLSFPG